MVTFLRRGPAVGLAAIAFIAGASLIGVGRLNSNPPSAPATGRAPWAPKPGTTWQWQLSGRVHTSVKADVFDIDMFENHRHMVSRLHKKGVKVVCYIDAGTW